MNIALSFILGAVIGFISGWVCLSLTIIGYLKKEKKILRYRDGSIEYVVDPYYKKRSINE